MSDAPKTLLVIPTHVKITAKALRELDASGFVVVRGEPGDFHVIGNHPPLTDAMVFGVAMKTIAEHSSTNANQVRWSFARNLTIALGYGDTVKMP